MGMILRAGCLTMDGEAGDLTAYKEKTTVAKSKEVKTG
jgi:hypothetical protein